MNRDDGRQGVTEAERYLARLCRRTFLSLWSYPNVVRDEFVPGTKIGKEVCDLLVVFENRILIFSDKDCRVPATGNLELDWSRWFRGAVLESAKLAYGAESWLRRHPHRVFLDPTCTIPLLAFPQIKEDTRFHLILVAHKIAERCHKELGGSGSLMLRSDLKGKAAHSIPFTIGDVNPSKSFVHILDDTSLDVLMRELDTISDFVIYLDKKEEFFRSGRDFFCAGEEELLAWYLRHTDESGEHCFKIPETHTKGIAFLEGHYATYLGLPGRRAKVDADTISYAWDLLIKKFIWHAVNEKQYFKTESGVYVAERILRFMARERRVRRRFLARTLIKCINTTPPRLRRTTVVKPSSDGDPYYLFLMIPWEHSRSEHWNREARLFFLRETCKVVRLVFSDALDVVGIGSESGCDIPVRTEDAVYCDFRQWTGEDEQDARKFQEVAEDLLDPKIIERIESEYPA